MAALILRDGASFDAVEFAKWIDSQSDVGPKWRPRYVRVASELPATATNKVLKRTLVHQKFRGDRVGGDPIWVRGRGEDVYRAFTAEDETALQLRFAEAGRERFWDL